MPGTALLRAQFLLVSIQAVAALYLSTSSAVKLSYSRLIIDTKSNSICFHQDKDSSEVALLSTCDFASQHSSPTPGAERCAMPKLVPGFAQSLFWAGCKAISLCYLSAQTNGASPTLCIASVSGSLTVKRKMQSSQEKLRRQLFPKPFFATRKFHKLQSPTGIPPIANSVHCLF